MIQRAGRLVQGNSSIHVRLISAWLDLKTDHTYQHPARQQTSIRDQDPMSVPRIAAAASK